MTSFRQLEANRRNALLSTGPRTEAGKGRSRRNALRHGLTAETVVTALEDFEDYQAFEASVIADYDAHSTVERELVLRLASLLWRMRRATAIETNLFQIQAKMVRERRQARDHAAETESSIPASETGDGIFGSLDEALGLDHDRSNGIDGALRSSVNFSRELAVWFLRLANIDCGAFERLRRYEAALWRQTVQTLLTLRACRYR